MMEGIMNMINNMEWVEDYNLVKDKLFIKVSGSGKDMVDGPKTFCEDMVITYYILIEKNADGVASVPVRTKLMEKYGVSVERLHNDALVSSAKLFPVSYMNLADWGNGEDIGLPSIIVSNKDMWNGASAIFYPGVMQKLARDINEDFYVLPSSIHEMIVIPCDGFEEGFLSEMVRSVNEGIVDETDVLTGSVYRYYVDEGVFRRVA